MNVKRDGCKIGKIAGKYSSENTAHVAVIGEINGLRHTVFGGNTALIGLMIAQTIIKISEDSGLGKGFVDDVISAVQYMMKDGGKNE